MRKRILLSALSLALVFSFFACAPGEYGHAELSIPLSEDFEVFAAENFDVAYTDGKSVVGIYRISFAAGFNQGIPDTFTAKEFASFYMKQSGRECEIYKSGSVPWYEYTEENDGVSSYYLASFFRSKYAYFLVLFACPENNYPELKESFLSYAEGVIFTQ